MCERVWNRSFSGFVMGSLSAALHPLAVRNEKLQGLLNTGNFCSGAARGYLVQVCVNHDALGKVSAWWPQTPPAQRAGSRQCLGSGGGITVLVQPPLYSCCTSLAFPPGRTGSLPQVFRDATLYSRSVLTLGALPPSPWGV